MYSYVFFFKDELEKELEELEQEELDRELLGTGPTTDQLPSVPATPLPSKTKTPAGQCLIFEILLVIMFWRSLD